MNYKSLIVGAVIAILGLGVGAGFTLLNTVSPGEAKTIAQEVLDTFGAVTNPDISSPWLRWGSVTEYRSKQTMQTATTTLCWAQNPRSATSTIRSFLAQINTGTSTAAAITLATSTSRYATSTSNELIADHSVASGAQATISWNDSTSNANILGPSEYVILQTAAGGLGGYTYGGHCQFRFEAIIP